MAAYSLGRHGAPTLLSLDIQHPGDDDKNRLGDRGRTMLKSFTGAIGDFQYRVPWGRGARDVVIWEGSVFHNGQLVGGPN